MKRAHSVFVVTAPVTTAMSTQKRNRMAPVAVGADAPLEESPLAFLDRMCGLPAGGVLSPRSCYAGGAVMTALDRQDRAVVAGSHVAPFGDIDIFVQCRRSPLRGDDPSSPRSLLSDHHPPVGVFDFSCGCGCAGEWRRLLRLFRAQLPECTFRVYHTANIVNVQSPQLSNHEIQIILTDKSPLAMIEQFDLDATRCAVLHDGSVLATSDQVRARTDRRVRVYAKRTLPYRWHKIRVKGYAIPAYLDEAHNSCEARQRASRYSRTPPHGAAVTDVAEVMRALGPLETKTLNYFELERQNSEDADCVGVTDTTVRWLRPAVAATKEDFWVDYEVGVAPTGRDGPVWVVESTAAKLELVGSVCGWHLYICEERRRQPPITLVWLSVSATLYATLVTLFRPLLHPDHEVSAHAAPPDTNARGVVTDRRLTGAMPATPFHGANTLVVVDYSANFNSLLMTGQASGDRRFTVKVSPKACRDETRTSPHPLLVFRTAVRPERLADAGGRRHADEDGVRVPEGLYLRSTRDCHEDGERAKEEEGSLWWLRSDRSGTLEACARVIHSLVYEESQADDATRTFWPRTGFPTVLQLRQSVLPWHPGRRELFPAAYRRAAEWLLRSPRLPVEVWRLVLTYTTRDWIKP